MCVGSCAPIIRKYNYKDGKTYLESVFYCQGVTLCIKVPYTFSELLKVLISKNKKREIETQHTITQRQYTKCMYIYILYNNNVNEQCFKKKKRKERLNITKYSYKTKEYEQEKYKCTMLKNETNMRYFYNIIL